MTTNNTREIILDVLLAVNRDGQKSHVVIRNTLDKYQYLPRQDRAFIRRVCEGTIEQMIFIDYIIDSYSSIKVQKMKPVIRDILRSAVYQIVFMDSVPASAACNEAVKLAQRKGFYNLKSFVNGVLRSIVRELEQVEYPSRNNLMEFLSVTYSMPRWLVKRWTDEFGSIVTELMLKEFLKERPTTVRLTTSGVEKKEILKSLKRQGVKVRHAPYLCYAYEISEFNFIQALEAYRNGWIYIQDVSSMLVAEAAAPKQGDFVVDLCAAPGGKSLHVADKLGRYGMVEARDLTEAKVALIQENIQRMDLINVRAVQADATIYDGGLEGRADIVLADVPCSGMGVIGRKADIKYKLTSMQLEELVLLQRRILHNAASYVKPGGTLIYSTCTIGKKENLENIQWFIENYPYELDSLDPYIPDALHSLTTREGYLQLLPGIHRTDGFFLARLKRRNDV
ncbi:MAG: 16S rRNA (cytosine(967)-C(5))-methyltransferase RsmB [Lachnospiraceae bacterium]|nr:16S rRNA (cytosine(967)-C(5))-methyltransferase RsmB [Lachnospiraceae bacterium]